MNNSPTQPYQKPQNNYNNKISYKKKQSEDTWKHESNIPKPLCHNKIIWKNYTHQTNNQLVECTSIQIG
jgi:hypothetical protein